MSDSDLEDLESMVGAVLAKEIPTPDRIREQIAKVRRVFPGVTDDDAESLARKFEHVHGVKMTVGATLEGKGFEKWLDAARATIEPFYWTRYRRLLAEQDFSGPVLATIDDVTDRILGLAENPEKPGAWDRRGMVVGHVQSGKTANYTGLVCKAADAGYQVIIVIAGIHNNLRGQTQRRIDAGFVGFDSTRLLERMPDAESIVGVGRFDSSRRPNTFTNVLRDFDKKIATGVGIPLENLRQPVVFVIKKNTTTLRNLIEWLNDQNARRGIKSISSPMLLIDDEADNASINVAKGAGEASRINGQIRALLRMFDRSTYIGYTATPFANIFIDPDSEHEMVGDDLFPRDFIVSLDPPDNYFGARKVFIDETDRIIRHIDDHDALLPLGHKKGHRIGGLPNSLIKAMRTFVLARAIRLVRGQVESHNSMLVNVSRFTDVQASVRNEVHAVLNRMRASIRVNGALPPDQAMKDPEISALQEVFEAEHEGSGVAWSDILVRLHDSIGPINVVAVNSASPGTLDYEGHKEGLNVIAVGGFSLSRGLTLEGLVVSYFLRNSMMYDTLMQMGRWFGYRPGYEDLCRIWMPREAEGWYAHVTESIDELREELRRMEAAGATPTEFGLKVRSHPDTLIVTARNKMGTSQAFPVSIGLANRFIETWLLSRAPADLDANRKAVVRLAQTLRDLGHPPESGEETPRGWLVKAVPVEAVTEFLGAFRNHPESLVTESEPVRRYIGERAHDELGEWDVLFAGISEARADKNTLRDGSLGVSIRCQRRADAGGAPATLRIEKSRVSSRGVEQAGLDEGEIASAKAGHAGPNYPDLIFRKVRKRPLLVIHLLAIGNKDDDLSGTKPVVAWSISFPPTGREEKTITYMVNTTWFREHYGDEAEEEAAGDE